MERKYEEERKKERRRKRMPYRPIMYSYEQFYQLNWRLMVYDCLCFCIYFFLIVVGLVVSKSKQTAEYI